MMVSFTCLTNSHEELGQGVGTSQSWKVLTETLEVFTTLPEMKRVQYPLIYIASRDGTKLINVKFGDLNV